MQVDQVDKKSPQRWFNSVEERDEGLRFDASNRSNPDRVERA
jgi:hypothetical protein